MRPVGRRMKSLDKGGMGMLHLFERLRVLKVKIREAQLHFALRFNQVLPGFPLLDMEGLNR